MAQPIIGTQCVQLFADDACISFTDVDRQTSARLASFFVGIPRRLACTFACAATLVCSSGGAQTIVAGFTPASFRVTETGAAEYRIPIQVPPGIAGMEPKLALTYNSQAGNGLLGVGWSLEGLSSITRCPRTVAQDAFRGAVSLDHQDKFCLDGQRLMAITGSYGGNGTEYRTERESFIRAVSYGAAGNGPAWFKVWTKSGQILEYGNTTDSRIEAQGKPTVRVWAVNRISDSKGNQLSITYAEDNANGDYRPLRVDYDYSAPGVSHASARFTYEARPDSTPAYVAGSVLRSMQRLANVRTYVGETLIRDYRLAYGQESATQRSILTSIAACADAGCLPSLSFGWQGSGGSFNASGYHGLHTFGSDPARMMFADVNGDGLADFIHVNGTAGIHVHLADGQGGFSASGYHGLQTFGSDPARMRFADINGDGRADFIHVNGTAGIHVHLADGQGGFSASGYHGLQTFGSDPARMMFADVNGDGLEDFIHVNGTAGIHVHLADGQGGFSATGYHGLQTFGSDPARMRFADINGDGMADFIHVNGTAGIHVHLADGQGGFSPTGYHGLQAFGSDPARMRFADINGDGRADFIHINGTAGIHVHLADGQGGFSASGYHGLQTFGSDPARMIFADVNGDGMADFVHVNGTAGIHVHLADGQGGFFSTGYHGLQGFGSDPLRMKFFDVDGDGRADFIHVNGTAGIHAHLATGLALLLTQVQSSPGSVTSIAYRPITDGAVYTKAADAVYPQRDFQGPIYVVSSSAEPDGIGGTSSTGRTYGGAKVDLQGRGFLGFRWFESTQQSTGTRIRTENRQDWPYAGLPALVKKTQSSGTLLGQTANIVNCTNPATGAACTVAAGNRYFPYVSQSVESGNDLNGAALPTLTTTTTYDTHGNATSVVVTGDGFSKTTSNIFTNDVPNWILGRLTRSTVQSTAP